MFLDKYLTEYDDSLTAESWIDPLGMLVIWSAFGQKVFKNRVNSISNDVRNYTLNLLNHYLIRKLINDDAVTLPTALQGVYGGKNSLHFKYACIVYLENIFVYSILAHENRQATDSGGVLGSVKARRIWQESGGNPTLQFTHEKSAHILVRQLSLGVNGRYKTPMVTIGYFDDGYQYQAPQAQLLWEKTEQFINSNSALKNLTAAIYGHLQERLRQNTARPQLSFEEIPSELCRKFAQVFSSSRAVGQFARDYWLTVTGLDTGTAGALLKVLDENAKSGRPLDLNAQQLFALASKKELTEEGTVQIQNIECLEPFLGDVTLLFTLLTSKKTQPVQDVVEQWQRFGRDAETLARGARRVRCDHQIINVLNGLARSRLVSLLGVENIVSVEEQIRLLVTYHSKVMEGRAQPAWVSIDAGGLLQLHARPSVTPDPQKWPVGCWANSYYIPQFKWLVTGLQGQVP